MTPDDIIRLYKTANGWNPEEFDRTVQELERFAALVAQHEREACAIAGGAAADAGLDGQLVAAAIRARGETK
jgi:hypothetical protein